MAVNQQSLVSPLLVGEGIANFEAITPELVDRDIPYLLGELAQQFDDLERGLGQRLKGLRANGSSGVRVLRWRFHRG